MHLITNPEVNNFVTTFPVGGSDVVESLKFVVDEANTPSPLVPPLKRGISEEGLTLENTPSNSANLPPLKRGISGDGFVKGEVWINKDQYFGDVPEVAWNFYIGGYQPAQKYLKDRKASKLNNQEIEQYQRIVKILTETYKLMEEI